MERLVDVTIERRTRCENAVIIAIPWDDPVASISQDALNKGGAYKQVEEHYHRMYALYSSLLKISPVRRVNGDDNRSSAPKTGAAATIPLNAKASQLSSAEAQPTSSGALSSIQNATENSESPKLVQKLSSATVTRSDTGVWSSWGVGLG